MYLNVKEVESEDDSKLDEMEARSVYEENLEKNDKKNKLKTQEKLHRLIKRIKETLENKLKPEKLLAKLITVDKFELLQIERLTEKILDKI